MKKNIFCILIASSLTFSCSNSDFLDLNPLTQISEAEFYKNEEQTLMGLYAVMHDVQVNVVGLYNNVIYLSDEGISGGGPGEGGPGYRFDSFTYNETNSPGWWGQMYSGIQKCNLLLASIDNVDMNDAKKTRIKAEAAFHRALFYSYLFMGYEQSIIIDKPFKGNFYDVTKASREETYQFIMSDLDNSVVGKLPPMVSSSEAGRITNDAALVLKTKMILFARDESRYSEALQDLKTIIGKYSLVSDFKELWLKGGEFSSESIMEIVFSDKANSNDWGNQNAGEGNPLPKWISGRDLIDPRTEAEGGLLSGWGQGTVQRSFYDKYENGDKRREGTFIDYAEETQKAKALYPTANFLVASNQVEFNGLGHYKYHARKGYTSTSATEMLNYNNNYRYYRYADVLLLATELTVRINGAANAEAQGWFNQVRHRAFGDDNHTPNLLNMGKQIALNTIFDERGLEFAYEMNRWFDIMRFDKGAEILGSKGWSEKFRYMPISQNDLDNAKGSLEQNPGWK